MARRDDDYLPVFLVRCRVAVRKFISVIYVFPKIWFGVDGNADATSKKSLHLYDSSENWKRRNRVEAV